MDLDVVDSGHWGGSRAEASIPSAQMHRELARSHSGCAAGCGSLSQSSARNGKTKCSGVLSGADEENKEGTAPGQAVQGWERPPQELAELLENRNAWLWGWQSKHRGVCSEGLKRAGSGS